MDTEEASLKTLLNLKLLQHTVCSTSCTILFNLHHQAEAQSQKHEAQINLKQWLCWFLVCRRWCLCILAASPLSHAFLLKTCISARAPPWLASSGSLRSSTQAFTRSECCFRKLCSLGTPTPRTQAAGSKLGRSVETGEVNIYPAAAFWTSKRGSLKQPCLSRARLRHGHDTKGSGRRLQHRRWHGRCRRR